MNRSIFPWRSLNTRITLFTLAIFVGSIWLLAAFSGRMLRQDMEKLLGEQQYSTVSFMASELNQELNSMVKTLEVMKANLGSAVQLGPAAVQEQLEKYRGFQQQFNGGTLVTGVDGVALASVPSELNRRGISYLDRPFVVTALTEGKVAFGALVVGKKFNTPVFVIAVPIFDTQGKVIACLLGVTNLNTPNFFSNIAGYRYGKSGGYLLIDPSTQMIIAASDDKRVMAMLPAYGFYPKIDRYLNGAEGTSTLLSPSGIESLVSVRRVAMTGWLLAANLPTEEAFSPIRTLQDRLMFATLLLSIVAGFLTWWMLRRQLTPLAVASRTLAEQAKSLSLPQALPVARHDEIGALVGGFNHLLEVLASREASLKYSEERFRFLIADLRIGVLIQTNTSSIVLSNQRALQLLGLSEDQLLGKSSFDPDWNVIHEDGSYFPGKDHPVPQVIASRHAVLNVVMGVFRPASNDRIWLLVNADPEFNADGSVRQVVCTFDDITDRKLAQETLQSNLKEKVGLLNEVHHRVKNNLQIITSLLRLESGRSTQADTSNVLNDMQGRIRSMALLHEALYRSGIFASADLGAYLGELATQSFRAQTNGGMVRLQLDLACIKVSMDQATPCGLLVNELISNCLKHAFPDGRKGELRVALHAISDTNKACLTVSDTGIGLPADFEARRKNSLGLHLVADLAKQINGVFEIEKGEVTAFYVTFTPDTQQT
ncbi:MAG: PAS domain S-box protein [Cytophaga sp.]|nr:PAS domain S-box protein [Undibacterium sp.]